MSGSYTVNPSAPSRALSSVDEATESTRSLPSATTLQPRAIVSWKLTGTISIFLARSQSTICGSVVSRQTAQSFSASMQTIRSMWT